MLASLAHFWGFFFSPSGRPWYEGAVWGNVIAVLPLGALGAAGLVYHHTVLKRLHRAHDRHLKAVLDLLDPDTDGGLADIRDMLDPDTPGGIQVLRARLDVLAGVGTVEPRQTDDGRTD